MRDFVRVPMPVLLVSRAAPEGVEAKVTKSGKSRRMPIADRVLSLVEACADGKGPDELLFTTKTGHQLHASPVKRAVHWSTVAPGRRIHDYADLFVMPTSVRNPLQGEVIPVSRSA